MLRRFRLEDVEAKLKETDREAAKTRNDSKSARDKFNELKKKRCELFNKAYVHISETIDQVYKDLTKGKAAPMGGVAYLSLEDNEVSQLLTALGRTALNLCRNLIWVASNIMLCLR